LLASIIGPLDEVRLCALAQLLLELVFADGATLNFHVQVHARGHGEAERLSKLLEI